MVRALLQHVHIPGFNLQSLKDLVLDAYGVYKNIPTRASPKESSCPILRWLLTGRADTSIPLKTIPLVTNVHLSPLVYGRQQAGAFAETCLPKDNPHEVI